MDWGFAMGQAWKGMAYTYQKTGEERGEGGSCIF